MEGKKDEKFERIEDLLFRTLDSKKGGEGFEGKGFAVKPWGKLC